MEETEVKLEKKLKKKCYLETLFFLFDNSETQSKWNLKKMPLTPGLRDVVIYQASPISKVLYIKGQLGTKIFYAFCTRTATGDAGCALFSPMTGGQNPVCWRDPKQQFSRRRLSRPLYSALSLFLSAAHAGSSCFLMGT